MAFPPQYFFTLMEAAGRLGCTPSQIVDWAIADEIDLVATIAPVLIGEEEIGGLMSVAGSEIRPLFRSVGRAEKKVCVRSVRPQGSTEWRLIASPAKGVKLTAGDILITASEIDRFEAAHGISRRTNVGPGAPSRYDWDGFYIALKKRVFTHGLPPRQKDLIDEMQEWFIQTSDTGEAPDESTIRRRIRAVWQELHPE
ncbi:hypothetical protein KY389_12590 [Paracoccus bogoriensis]|uniref:hypothetical protein n=1 Tax=Paracoccus bogoriensis TaxID=242065 RepID=UPI001CA5CA4E|nr:hypothetical protein [Paracoccus bogoriensis]MBW7057520.1 hypothetical protein [Paracoccus bogoriensis]